MVNAQLLEAGPGRTTTDFLGDLYTLLDDALDQASGALAGTAGMGGRVTTFTAPYDAVARSAFLAGCRLAGAVAQLRLMVATTFDNYALAEHAADIDLPGTHILHPPRTISAPYPSASGPPSAVGDNGGEPWVWHVVTALHPSAQWPDVATGSVRRAAGGWSALAAAYGQASTYLDCATADLRTYRAPELPLACAVLERLGRHMTMYADECSALAATLLQFADSADSAISQMQHQCHVAEFEAGAGTGAAIVVGALTFGVGGVASEGGLEALLAGTIGVTIADLATDFLATAAALCEGFQVMGPVLEGAAVAAGGIVEAKTVEASFESMESAATVGGRATASGLGRYQLTLSELEHLERTTATHVIARHVGRTPEQLAMRFKGKRSVPYSSTFPDADTALACINEKLAGDESKIQHWFEKTSLRVLPLEGDATEPIGIVMDPDGTVTTTRHYRVVLVRDDLTRSGLRVDSAYPIH